jgi:hypothetical protein
MNTETLAFYASKRSSMTTQTTPETPTNALAIVPQGDQWQVIPPTRPLTLEERLQRLIELCDRSAKLADEIAASLNK